MPAGLSISRDQETKDSGKEKERNKPKDQSDAMGLAPNRIGPEAVFTKIQSDSGRGRDRNLDLSEGAWLTLCDCSDWQRLGVMMKTSVKDVPAV